MPSTEHVHTIQINTKTSVAGIKPLTNKLKGLQEQADKTNESLQNISVDVNVDTSSAEKSMNALVKVVGVLAKSIIALNTKGIESVGSTAGTSTDEVQSLEDAVGDMEKTLDGVDGKGLESVGTSAGKANDEVLSLEDSLADIDRTLASIDGGGLESIGDAAAKANDEVQTLNSSTSSLGNTVSSLDGSDMLSYLGLGTATDTIVGTSAKKETNKITADLKGYNIDAIDEKTNSALVSMQAVIPAMNAIQTAAGATGDQMNDSMGTIVDFGTYVQALTGSSTLAENAMYDLSKGVKGAFASLDQYGITEDALVDAGWSGQEDDFEGYMNAISSLIPSSETYLDTFNGKIALLGKRFSSAGGQIGQAFLPYIEKLIDWFLELNDKMGNLPIKALLVAFTALSAIKPLGNFLQSLKSVKDTISGVVDKWKTFSKTLKESGFKAAFKGLTDPCAGIVTCEEKQKDLNEAQEEASEGNEEAQPGESVSKGKDSKGITGKIKDVANKGLEKIKDSLKGISKAGDKVTNGLSKGFSKIGSSLSNLMSSFSSLGSKVVSAVTGMGSSVLGVVDNIKSVAKQWASLISDFTSSRVKRGLNSLKNSFSNLSSTVKSTASGITTTLTGAFSTAGKTGSKGFLSNVKSKISSGVKGVSSKVTKGFSGMIMGGGGSASSESSSSTGGKATSAVSKVSGKVKGSFRSIGSSIGGVMSRMAGMIGNIMMIGMAFTMVATIATKALNALGYSWSDVLEGFKSGDLSDIGSSINEKFTGIVDKIKNTDWAQTFGNIGSAIKSFFTSIDWGGLASGLISGIGGMLSGLWTALSGYDWVGGIESLLSGIGGWITSALGGLGDSVDASGGADGIISSIGSALMSALSGLWEIIKFIIGNIGGWIWQGLSSIDWVGAIGGLLSGLGGAIMSVLGSLGGWIVSALAGIPGMVLGALGGLGDALASVGQWVWDSLSSIDWIGAILAGIGDIAGAVWDEISGALGSVWDSLTSWLPGGDDSSGGDTSSSSGGDASTSTAQIDTTQLQEATATISDVQAQLDAAVQQVNTSVTNMTTIFANAFTAMNTYATTFFTTFNTNLTMINTGITLFNTNLTLASTSMTTLATSTTMASTSMATLVANITMLCTSIMTLIVYVQMIQTVFSTAFVNLAAIVTAGITGVIVVLSSLGTVMVTIMTNAATMAVTAFQGSFTGLSDAVDSEMDGAIASLNSKGAVFIALAGSIGAQAAAAFKAALGIGSPGYIWTMTEDEMAGTVGAVENSYSDLSNAAAGAGSTLASSFMGNNGMNVSTGNMTGGATNTSSIYTPVADLSEASGNVVKANDQSGNGNGQNTINHTWNISGEFDSEQRVDQLVGKITKALTFENNRAGRTVGTIYEG